MPHQEEEGEPRRQSYHHQRAFRKNAELLYSAAEAFDERGKNEKAEQLAADALVINPLPRMSGDAASDEADETDEAGENKVNQLTSLTVLMRLTPTCMEVLRLPLNFWVA